MLTLDGELVKALFQACIYSSTEDNVVIDDAARRIRKVLFLNDQTFNGDVSRQCHIESVPNILIRLVSLILNRGNYNDEEPSDIATNLAVLIR